MAHKASPIFLATVKEGKVLFEEKDLLKIHLSNLEGKEIEVIVRPRRKERTTPQNRWYWGCVVAIPAHHYGYTPDEMHTAYKLMFLRAPQDMLNGPPTLISTAKLTTTEFTEYIENCRKWCAEQGLFIPDPDSVYV